MQKYSYPKASEHKGIHAELVQEVVALVNKFEAGQTVMSMSVLDFLENWLTKHICCEDVVFAAFLKTKGVTA